MKRRYPALELISLPPNKKIKSSPTVVDTPESHGELVDRIAQLERSLTRVQDEMETTRKAMMAAPLRQYKWGIHKQDGVYYKLEMFNNARQTIEPGPLVSHQCNIGSVSFTVDKTLDGEPIVNTYRLIHV